MEIHKQTETETQSVVITNSSLPSPSSSPSHEFSFAISLQDSNSAPHTPAPEQPPVIDLSPADEIFFHGHLLPLHFLSHLHLHHAASPPSPSPSPSTTSSTSLDCFTHHPNNTTEHSKKPSSNITMGSIYDDTDAEDDLNDCISYSNVDLDSFHQQPGTENFTRMKEGSNKQNPFSLFGLAKKKKPSDCNNQNQNLNRKKLRFDFSEFLKRYIRMVKPLLTSRGEKIRVRRQSYSFSGVLSPREKSRNRGRRGEFSAPASMRTSPTNSGLLAATAGVPPPAASDSTMDELQAAIQAAIAHCKSSIDTGTQVKKPHELVVVPAT